jgi:thiol-disulfide isomerase/thioredoxin
MPILIAAVAAVGGLCLLDLLLTFGVIRRLREHTSMLTGAGARGSEPPAIGLAAGKPPGLFSAVTTSGEEVTGVAGLRVVAFFSSWCSTCPERVPPFVEYLSEHRIGRDSVLAVVAADNSTPAPYLEQLAEVALACVEPTGGEIATAFQVKGFPAFFLLDADGVVAVNGYDPATLPEPATV